MKFSVGDVVFFNPKAQLQEWYPRWAELNGTGSFEITELVGEIGYWVKPLNGGNMAWDDEKFGHRKNGIDGSWMTLNKFLTAVRKVVPNETR